VAKLIIELDIDSSDWDESDPKRFCDLVHSDNCTAMNVEIGGPHQNPDLADEGVAWHFELGTSYFKVRIENE
jgi:hypothetical protein